MPLSNEFGLLIPWFFERYGPVDTRVGVHEIVVALMEDRNH